MDNKNGNEAGEFMPLESRNLPSNKHKDLNHDHELPAWQKELFDKRMELLQKYPERVMALEDFLMKMEQEADEEI